MRRWRQTLAAKWSKTTTVMIRIHKTGITYLSKLMEIDAASVTYLSKLVEIDAAVAPDLSGKVEQDNHCHDSDSQDWYHLPF
jgi:hypothetical protein